jgi:putative ATP-dependent endonuclease of OLD family
MRLRSMRLRNFQCFGPAPTSIGLTDMTCLLGPNGAGKTATLQGLARMFGVEPRRAIRRSDFHVPVGDDPSVPVERQLWLEADFDFPELGDDPLNPSPAVPAFFAHMQLVSNSGAHMIRVRIRLSAELDISGEVHEHIEYVLATDAADEPTETMTMSRFDRRQLAVHYLPARRDPSEHVSYASNALLGRWLRAIDWDAQRDAVGSLAEEMSRELGANAGVSGLAAHLVTQWGGLHSGSYFKAPSVSFLASEIQGLLRQVTINFAPAHDQQTADFSLLSDGQQSLLYLSLVLALHAIGQQALADELDGISLDKLSPPVFTLLAVEEPENSLSPHLLGRVLKALTDFAAATNSQTVVATHAPSLVRRVEPENIRYLRLGAARETQVATVQLPADDVAAQKYIREALHAYPEIYFSRLVVLGEGDSEQVVLPRCLEALDLGTDAIGVTIAPLGGRHVNHFWRLLHGLSIPYLTLLDLDLARYQGGWGRIRYACSQLVLYPPPDCPLTSEHLDQVPEPGSEPVLTGRGERTTQFLEKFGVFFSSPLDLDFAMQRAFPQAYDLQADELQPPDEHRLKSVLGKSHGPTSEYSDDDLQNFDGYYKRFKLQSKPAAHVLAMSSISLAELAQDMPASIERLVQRVASDLKGLPE